LPDRAALTVETQDFGLVECSLVRCCGGKVRRARGLGVVEAAGKLGQLGAEGSATRRPWAFAASASSRAKAVAMKADTTPIMVINA
jgi:hypothetical protein